MATVTYYVLPQDVTNPHPDRRSKSKLHQVVWKKGWRLELRETEYSTQGISHVSRRLRFVGDVAEYVVAPGGQYKNDERWRALHAAMCEDKSTAAQLKMALDGEPDWAFQVMCEMVDMGMVSVAQVREAYTTWDERYDDNEA